MRLLHIIQNNGYKGTLYEDDFDSPIVAFADDLLLLFDNKNEAQLQLDTLDKFLKNRGMTINASKSKCLCAARNSNKLVNRTVPFLRIESGRIPMVFSISTMKYLGHQYDLGGIPKRSIAPPNHL